MSIDSGPGQDMDHFSGTKDILKSSTREEIGLFLTGVSLGEYNNLAKEGILTPLSKLKKKIELHMHNRDTDVLLGVLKDAEIPYGEIRTYHFEIIKGKKVRLAERIVFLYSGDIEEAGEVLKENLPKEYFKPKKVWNERLSDPRPVALVNNLLKEEGINLRHASEGSIKSFLGVEELPDAFRRKGKVAVFEDDAPKIKELIREAKERRRAQSGE